MSCRVFSVLFSVLRPRDRCALCWLPSDRCACAQCTHAADILQREGRLPHTIVVYMHHKEYAKSSNTPCLLQWLGPAAHILVHGVEEHEKRLDALIARSGSRALVLFPGESSVDVSDVLARDEGARAGEDGQVGPAVDGWTVVVVDGSWRQARKMERRPCMSCLSHRCSVSLENKNSLSLNPRYHETCLS